MEVYSRHLPLTRLMAYTTACATVRAVIRKLYSVFVADTRISVFLGSDYFGGNKVEGLCGNYNDISDDDFGADTNLASSIAEQAAAWKIIPSCPEPDTDEEEDPCEVRLRI